MGVGPIEATIYMGWVQEQSMIHLQNHLLNHLLKRLMLDLSCCWVNPASSSRNGRGAPAFTSRSITVRREAKGYGSR